jgi:hypothetical protein
VRTFLTLLLLAVALAAQDKKAEKKPAPPKLAVALPLAVEPGKKAKLTVRGSNLDGLTAAKVHEPKSKAALVGQPKKVGLPNNYPLDRVGDTEVEIELDVAKEAPGGTVAVSVIGPGGESNAVKVALADDTPRAAEKEPNDGFDQPQVVTLPAVVDGTIGRERDVDVFRFTGKAGDKVRVEVHAARLNSPADLMLTLLDADRKILDTVDDANGSADPVVVRTLPRDGTYYVSVLEANDLGGSMFAYRLTLRTE